MKEGRKDGGSEGREDDIKGRKIFEEGIVKG